MTTMPRPIPSQRWRFLKVKISRALLMPALAGLGLSLSGLAAAQQQAAAAKQQQQQSFNRGFSACMQAKGYTVN
jgi:hypothetical protein